MKNEIKKEEFNIYEFIGFAETHYNKFYKKFVLSFDTIEAMEVGIKIAINIENECYKILCYGNIEVYSYHKIIRDLGINYGIYKNEREFRKDYRRL